MEFNSQPDPEGRKALLVEALNWGESGIDLWLESIRDPDLGVRALAYEYLQKSLSPRSEVLEVLEQGICLNPGDIIYCVYRSGIWYTDEIYVLSSDLSAIYDSECQPWIEDLWKSDYRKEEYSSLEDFIKSAIRECGIPALDSVLTQKEEAERVAQALHRDFSLQHLFPDKTLPPEGYVTPFEFEVKTNFNLIE